MKGNEKPGKGKKPAGKILLMFFGVLSSAAAAILLFAGIEALPIGEGRGAPVMTICLSFLFTLLSVLIHLFAAGSHNWSAALFRAAAGEACAGIIILISIGKSAGTWDMITAVLLTVSAVLFYFLKKSISARAGRLIPIVLGILAVAAGILMLNTAAYIAVSRDLIQRLWIGIIFGVFFLILSYYMTNRAYPQERRYRGGAVSFGSALCGQFAAFLYGIGIGVPNAMKIGQGCILAGLAAVFLAFLLRDRTPIKIKNNKRQGV